MQTVIIDRKKDADVDDWAQDQEPGNGVRLYGTIKSLDDQKVEITVSEVEDDDRSDDDEDEKASMGNEGSDAAPVGSPPGSLGALSDEESAA